MTPFDQHPWYETLLTVLDWAAESIAYHHEKYLPKEDGYQDAWVWALEHPLLVASFLDKEKPDVTGLNRVVMDYLRLVAQKEKARQCGYHVDDVAFYTPRVIAELLPATMDLEAALAPTAAPTDDVGGGKSGSPHAREEYVASLLDVRNAWICTAFRGDESRLIEARYVDQMDWAHIAASFGIEMEEAKKRVAIGLRRMSDFLGGHKGRKCPVDCVDCAQRFAEEER